MSSWDPEKDVQLTDSEDEEDIAMKRDFNGREAILFVVDAYLQATNSERLFEALNIIRSAFISGMMLNHKDLMGLLFDNTKFSPPPLENNCLDNIVVPENAAVFMPLRQLNKNIVNHFIDFLGTVPKEFATDYGMVEPKGSGNFAATIQVCIKLLQNSNKKINNAKIVYLTDVETPHDPANNAFQAALQKAIDLEGQEIEFHVIPMVDNFDYDPFYKEFITLSRGVEMDSFVVPDAQQLREKLQDRKLKQDYLRRCLGHFTFALGPNLDISVQYYPYFHRRSYPKKVKILRRDNNVVAQKRVTLVRKENEETQVTREYQIKVTGGWHEIKLGETSIRITTEQLNRVRNLHAPGMMLLGFKHRSSLPDIWYSKPANFMYPDDQNIKGSKRLFRALWQRCLEREKIAICLFMSKRKSTPRYVALLPMQAQSTETKLDQTPAHDDGFKIFYLPAAKHIRHVDLCEWNSINNTASDEAVDFFEKVIKKLRMEYHSNLVYDPDLQFLQSNLLALALDFESHPDNNPELIDTALQDSRIAKFLPDYERLFEAEVELAKKRSAEPLAGNKAPKIPKINNEELKNYDYMAQLIRNNHLEKCTIAQLRVLLKENFDVDPPKATTKAKLVSTIESLFD